MDNAKLVFYAGSTLLEGPRWSDELNALLCVSIEQERIFLIDEDGQFVRTFKTHGQVGFALFKNKDTIIYASYEGVYELDIASGEDKFLFHANTDKALRYNDGDYDPKGRILLGTTGYKRFASCESSLYSANVDGTNIKKIVENTSISNGIAFSPDAKYLYFIDSPTKKIGRYEYDVNTGSCKFDKYIVEITGDAVPDGMCIDPEGNIYVAEWGGFKVCKWNPVTGKCLKTYSVPVQNVSSCTIGGKNHDTLFITTAAHDDGTPSEFAAGGLFKNTL
ncbi:SMP-30/gluconolactonase/LRE family protein [Fibrobacter succinogenes]|uniref:Sugar lactone lactonase YvrE n=1 Tax=Fibrobacter succinogenes TaxID=833 RepID=A0A380S8S0_FIBSU|nr:SMP-30/gluconolactonase/LRE family protein [Fibrobacter succinogenes]PWJ34863.1 sugar lactone lactonase YvrE [Fibrobacter succinogenes subsp. elongatus]SUQ24986.1 Sugar lactone lactonase YvrE [Fibrobacter succinogenes]